MSERQEELPVAHPKDLDERKEAEAWLVKGLWGRAAVGIVGGAPKCCKTWLGLEVAVSVASATPALGRFPVDDPGLALVYLAEDALPLVRERVRALAEHRHLDLQHLELRVITAPTLRLDLKTDQDRLRKTVERHRPRMLLLDPLVRLHRLDENSATEISGLLGYLREIQRAFNVAVVLVHHASKRHRSEPGQALRGSGDLHAFGDSNMYLARRNDQIVLTIEHRFAKAPEPLVLELVAGDDGADAHLAIANGPGDLPPDDFAAQVLGCLKAAARPMPRIQLRAQLRVKSERLGPVLADLERQGRILRGETGWTAAPSS